ncbi:hypothetical protein JKI95_06315 [Corynebacterium aquatimens]|uniref:hypothetical protein n=1 Tax=Corynebacterium TaxID=1716 RepID=UPI001F411EFA|nr:MULTISPECIES: hypothetical protein [Corynebacterium]QYH18949.1 hypothetical protein JKI95_06315 [Corynebacterium aquatimens]UIZ92220.1 hypothetical protein JZY91_11380 [Corynebacterium sp. CNCTC7651]
MQETIQDAVDETRIDYNALDNTFAGQLIQAGFIAALAAAPGFTSRPALARLLLAGANVTTIACFNAFDEDPRNDLTAVVDAEQAEQESVALSWGVLAALGAAATAGVAAAVKIVDGVASRLGQAGVDKPNALVGCAAAAGYIVAKQLRT